MTSDALRIHWQVDPLPQHRAPLALATPLVEVNGRPLFRAENPVVDILGLLVCSRETGSFDLLTCSCGVPGCAGFHEEVQVQADEDCVRWCVPAEGYRGALADAFGEGPWTFVFNRKDFEHAMAQAEAELLDAERRAGCPLALSPWEPWQDDETAPSVKTVLEKSRLNLERTRRQQRCFDTAFGDMAKKDICLHTPKRSFWMTVRQYAWAAESAAGLPCLPSTDAEFHALEQVLAEAAKVLRANPLEAVLRLPDDLLDCYVQAPGEERSVTDASGALYWRRADCRVTLGEAPPGVLR